jgi:two-component system cell cycle response regulator
MNPYRDDKTRISERTQITDLKARGQTPCLVQIYGQQIGHKTNLVQIITSIGRGHDNDIVCEMDNISREHCHIRVEQNNVWLSDLQSTNGTYLNDQEIRAEVKLHHGDMIKIGGTVFRFIEGDNIEQLYYEEIYRMAIVDGLTQIYNKRYFTEFIEREYARAQRHERPLSVIVFDIDHFKKINDTYLHIAGDYVLKKLCSEVHKTFIRKEECFARLGGEEFGIVLPDTPCVKAQILAEKIRRRIESVSFEFEGNDIAVTSSFGVAQCQVEETIDTWLKRADQFLYKSKSTGRNRVSGEIEPGDFDAHTFSHHTIQVRSGNS